MGGRAKISTNDVTASTLRSPFSKSKTRGNASVATPIISGHLTMSMLVIVVRCCSTCLAKGTSQRKEKAGRYTVAAIGGLVFMEVA